jgi:3-oxoacyl-[acyl-carrier-protein] synthase I
LNVSEPLTRFLAWEAVTSLGESARETAVLLRAGLVNVGPSRFIDAKGERVMMCTAPAVPPHHVGVERACELAHLALANLTETLPVRPEAILLGISERFAGDTASSVTSEAQTFLRLFRSSLPSTLKDCRVELFPYGRAAGAVALRRAIALVDSQRFVVWGGVDTWHDWPALETLERRDRLITAENIDGVRPGEAAAFVVLGPAGGDDIHVVGLGTGREPNPVGSEEPCRSLGLSDALSAAVSSLRAANQRTNLWLLDSTHEAYATQELQNVIARFGDVLGLRTELRMPLKELGDVGAAAMPLLSVLAAEAWRFGYAEDDTAVVTGSSPDGARGAMLLSAPRGYRPAEKVEKLTWAS